MAVAARSPQHAQDFAKKFGIPRAYGSYEELLYVAYIGSINPCHLQLGELFMNSKKNVLCERPLAMNSREVELLATSARNNEVFLMEAVETWFFPASLEISQLLAQGVVGDVKMVKVDLGIPLGLVPRSLEKELAGGALLEMWIYGLQFACMVYQGVHPSAWMYSGVPEYIQATKVYMDTGMLVATVIVPGFSGARFAVILCSIHVEYPNDATILGTEGMIKIPSPMWIPTSLIVNGKETQYPLPEPSAPLNFIKSTGMRYEAEEVWQCLLRDLREQQDVTERLIPTG